jgi:hypothetical protein
MSRVTIVHEETWDRMVARLDALADLSPETAPFIDVVRKPVDVLSTMAPLAVGVLGNDVLAHERLRLLLVGAAPATAFAELSRRHLGSDRMRQTSSALAPGVLFLGHLGILGVAAARVAADDLSAQTFLATVHGLAIAAAPAELIARLEPYGASSEELKHMVRQLIPRFAVNLEDALLDLGAFALDLAERTRWACLRDLFTSLAELVPAIRSDWEIADSSDIQRVSPASASPGELLVLEGAFPWIAERDRWPDDVGVVFASEDPSRAILAREIDGCDPGRIALRVPPGAEPGWIGFSRAGRHAASDRVRLGVAELLEEVARASPCQEEGLSPRAAIPVTSHHPSHPRVEFGIPGRTPRNRYEGRA